MSSPRGVTSTTIPSLPLTGLPATHESPQKKSLHHRTDTSFFEAGRSLIAESSTAPLSVGTGVLSQLKLSIPSSISNKKSQDFLTKILGDIAGASVEESRTLGQAMVTDLPEESRSGGSPSSLTLGPEETPSPSQEEVEDEPEVSDAPPLVTQKHTTPSPVIDDQPGIGSALLREIRTRSEKRVDLPSTAATPADVVIERHPSFFLQEPSPLPSLDHTLEHVRNESFFSMQPGQDSSESHSPAEPTFRGTSPSAQQDKTGENVGASAEDSVSASQTTSSSGPTISDSTRAEPQSTTSSAPFLPPAAWWKRALVGTKKFCGSSLRWMGAGLKAIFTATTGRLLSNGFKLLKLLSSLWPRVRL
ncbi:MAG: hypothetical protein ACOYKZ_01080 [Chlamydiia bacterium]